MAETRLAPSASQRRRRLLLGAGLLAGLLVVALVSSLIFGSREIPLGSLWSALFGDPGTAEALVVRDQRLPRTAVGLVAGAALGIGGALVQAHTRNPLADPGLLGVSAGAAVTVAIGIAVFSVGTLEGQVWFALLGASIASVIVFVIGGTRGGSQAPITLALTGTAVTAFLTAVTDALLLLDSATLDRFRFWSVGSLAGRGLDTIGAAAPVLLLGLLAAAIGLPGLNTLALGDDVATALGQRVFRARVLGVSALALLTSGAVAVAGPMLFVGLVAPHAARAVTGPDYRLLVPCSAVAGAALVLLADALGRRILGTEEVQVGIMVALLGAPFFITLVRRRRMVAI